MVVVCLIINIERYGIGLKFWVKKFCKKIFGLWSRKIFYECLHGLLLSGKNGEGRVIGNGGN
jgi:hypothetical protein